MVTTSCNNLATVVSSQVRTLIDNLTKKNSKVTITELSELKQRHNSLDVQLFILSSLVDAIDFSDTKNIAKDSARLALLSQEFEKLSQSSNFSTYLLRAFQNTDINLKFITFLCESLHLPLSQELAIGTALTQSPDTSIQQTGAQFLKSKLDEIKPANIDLDNFPEHVLQSLLFFLKTQEGLSKHLHNVLETFSLTRQHITYETPLTLCSILVEPEGFNSKWSFQNEVNDGGKIATGLSEKLMSSVCPVALMKDIGYSCLSTPAQFQNLLKQFPPLKEEVLAKMIGLICTHHTGLSNNLSLQEYTLAEGWSANQQDKDAPKVNSWNLDVFVHVLKSLKINWNRAKVIRSLDYPGFRLNEPIELNILENIFHNLFFEPFPADQLLTEWNEKDGLLSILSLIILSNSNHCNIVFDDVKELIDISSQGKLIPTSPINHYCWFSIGLIEQLLWLAEADRYSKIRKLFDIAIKSIPEVLTIALARVKPSVANELHRELCSLLLPSFLVGHPNSNFVLFTVWLLNRNVLIQSMVDLYNADRSMISRILVVAQELKALSVILECRSYPFIIDLAALASRREYLFLQKWLPSRIKEYGEPFARACVDFLRANLQASADPGNRNISPLPSTLTCFLECLQDHISMFSPELCDAINQFQKPSIEDLANENFSKIYREELSISQAIELLKKLKESPYPEERALFDYMITNLFKEYPFFRDFREKELKITANLFGSIIRHDLLVDNNPNARQQVLNNALLLVLNGLKHAPSENMFMFGLNALEQFTSKLHLWPQFSMCLTQIPHLQQYCPDLINYINSSTSNKSPQQLPPHSQQDDLDQSLPQQKSHLSISHPNLDKLNPQQQPQQQQPINRLGRSINMFPTTDGYGVGIGGVGVGGTGSVVNLGGSMGGAGGLGGTMGSTGPLVVPLGQSGQGVGVGGRPDHRSPSSSSTSEMFMVHQELPLEGPFHDLRRNIPDEERQNKISFIFNNVSFQNMDDKASELQRILIPEYYPWLAQCVIVKRASMEGNNHELFLKLLSLLNLPNFDHYCLIATYHNIKLLLRSEKITYDVEERSCLKNLGSWLGSITLAQSKPILYKHLDFKSLLIEAYTTGRLIAAVPFIAKVLEVSKRSPVIRTSNAWITQQIRLLIEVYQIPQLKLNIKFEIELLCKNLQVNMDSLPPSEYLKSHSLLPPPNPDLHLDKQHPSYSLQQQQQQNPNSLQQSTGGAGGGGGFLSSQQGESSSQTQPQPQPQQSLVTIDPSLVLLSRNPSLRNRVQEVIQNTIREVCFKTIERSVTIAFTSTRSMIMKDFSTVPGNDPKIRQAAHLMIKNFASNLAIITCHFELQMNLRQQLHSLLNTNPPLADPATLENTILRLISTNIDLPLRITEQSTVQKAIMEIDDKLPVILQARKPLPYVQSLPEALRSDLNNGIQHHQWKVYEDFARPRISAEPIPTSSISPPPNQQDLHPPKSISTPNFLSLQGSSSSQSSVPGSSLPGLRGSQQQQQPQVGATQPNLSTGKGPITSSTGGVGGSNLNHIIESIHEQLKTLMNNIDDALSSSQGGFQIDHIRMQYRQLYHLIDQSPDRDKTCTEFAKFLIRRLYNSSSKVHVDSYLPLLEQLGKVTKQVQTDITNAYMFLPREHKFNRDISLRLLQAGLLKNAEFDSHIAQMINSGNAQALSFIVCLIEQSMSGPPDYKPIQKYDLPRCFDSIASLRNSGLDLTSASLNSLQNLNIMKSPSSTSSNLGISSNNAPNTSGSITAGPNTSGGSKSSGFSPIQQQQPQPPALSSSSPSDLSNSLESSHHDPSGSSSLGGNIALSSGQSTTDEYQYLHHIVRFQTDKPILQERIWTFWNEWKNECESGQSLESNSQSTWAFFHRLHLELLVSDELTAIFFGETLLKIQSSGESLRSLHHFSKLLIDYFQFCLEILAAEKRTSRSTQLTSSMSIKTLFKCVDTALTVVGLILVGDFQTNPMEFNQQRYHYVFSYWLMHLVPLVEKNESVCASILGSFCKAFSLVQPNRVAGFAYSWLELISHRNFMPKLLLSSPSKPSPSGPSQQSSASAEKFQQLLVQLFQFLEPFLRNSTLELHQAIREIYIGTLRVLLVLLHDFPEFLCDYHFALCDVIPSTCIQMRNLILSAFPREMCLPDPFTRNLKVERIPEIKQPPRICSNYLVALHRNKFIVDVETFLHSRSQPNPAPHVIQQQQLFLRDLRLRLLLPPQDAYANATKYNVPLMNSLVLYIGMYEMETSSPVPFEIFRSIAYNFDGEGRYHLFNAITNQLRYPNNQTQYFSCLLLHLFADAPQEIIKEQITRVLLERLIVGRPHPWGLLITFIELLKNTRYNFWSHAFTKCAPEVERLFLSVSQSCNTNPREESQ